MRMHTVDMSAEIVNLMASCHNLLQVNEKITGDKLEQELFKQSGYVRVMILLTIADVET